MFDLPMMMLVVLCAVIGLTLDNKKAGWYCTKCRRTLRFAKPAIDTVAYSTTGRVYKCWKCGEDVEEK